MTDDGTFKVRFVGHDEYAIQVRKECKGTYRRYTEESGNRIVFVKQGDVCGRE